jgi:hypothetical protein
VFGQASGKQAEPTITKSAANSAIPNLDATLLPLFSAKGCCPCAQYHSRICADSRLRASKPAFLLVFRVPLTSELLIHYLSQPHPHQLHPAPTHFIKTTTSKTFAMARTKQTARKQHSTLSLLHIVAGRNM